jgi:hypothetical protein
MWEEASFAHTLCSFIMATEAWVEPWLENSLIP